jgi:electron transport complex protein RnfD
MAESRTFKTNLQVSSSPHLVTTLDTRKTMMYVLIALIPSAVAATVYFGAGALLRIILGAFFAFASEWCYNRIMKKKDTTQDLSCLVTGVILAMNVPANFPVWMLAIGCGVAIVIVKCLYGGIGRNIANPAIVGRIVLLLSWTSYMTTWPLTRFQKTADAVTGATPLGMLADKVYDQFPSLTNMFIGNIGGALGETCTIAIILGGLFLIWKKIISPIIPCAFIATVFVIALVYYAVNPIDGYNAFHMALFHILGGGVFFGAFFCATDYVTSPIMNRGKLIYGIGCGVVTMVIRLMCSYPEGVSFAILFMNIMTPLIDRYVERQFYGIAAAEKAAKKAAKEAAAAGAKEAAK